MSCIYLSSDFRFAVFLFLFSFSFWFYFCVLQPHLYGIFMEYYEHSHGAVNIQFYIVYTGTDMPCISICTYILYRADISVHNLRLGILYSTRASRHFLFFFFLFLFFICFVYYFGFYLWNRINIYLRRPSPPTKFEKSICYKFKIIIGKKATYDSLLKWIWAHKKKKINIKKNSICAQVERVNWPQLTPSWTGRV